MENKYKNKKPFGWINKNNNYYYFTTLEVIEEEIEDTIFL